MTYVGLCYVSTGQHWATAKRGWNSIRHKEETEHGGGNAHTQTLLLSLFKNKNPLPTKIRFIKINIFKDANELHMNAGQCNPSISILGLQHFPTCLHPSKSKKSIKSGYGVWSHPLSEPRSARSPQRLTDRRGTCSLVFAASIHLQLLSAAMERCVRTRQLTK